MPLRVEVHQELDVLADPVALVESDVPDRLVGDLGRLRQVLVNLVGNAIKFTEEGEIILSVEPEKISPKGYDLLLSVTDTGIGIPAQYPALDESPHRAAAARQRYCG